MASSVRVEHRTNLVAVLTFDQPDSKANVLTPQVWSDFEAALDTLAGKRDIRGLVLASAKPGIFIAGADLKLLGNAEPNDPAVRAFIEQGLRTLAKLEALPFSTCAAIDGVALGGGLEVALACDVQICGVNPKIQLGLPETTLGLIPGWGGTQRLPRIVGLKHAAAMLESGKSLNARDAETIGLVGVEDVPDLTAAAAGFIDEVCVASALISRTMGRTIAAVHPEERERKQEPIPESERQQFNTPIPESPMAVREALRVMIQGAELPLSDAIQLETEAFLRLAGSDESKRLIAEFFASRKK